MGTYLDKTGLTKVWAKIKEHDDATLNAAKNYTDGLQTKLTDGTVVAGKATKDGSGNTISSTYVKKTDSIAAEKIYVYVTDTTTIGQFQSLEDFIYGVDDAITDIINSKGAANGIAPLNGSGKISTSYLPDSILGQVSYMGLFDASTSKATLSAGTIAQGEATRTLPTLSQFRVGNLDTSTYYTPTTGDYFIVNKAGTFDSIELNVGDWLIFNGGLAGWGKVDNTDAVSSVAGYTGAVTATQLANALQLGNITTDILTLKGYFTDGVANNAKNANYATNAGGATNANSALNDSDGNKIVDTYAKKTDIPTSLPASDVSAWAKAATKPTYTWSEITSKPTWIGSTKPTYTYTEVGAASSSHNHDTVYIKKTDTIDAEKIYIDENADWQYIEQPQGFGDFLVKTDAGLAAINNSVNSITALTEADINEVCV